MAEKQQPGLIGDRLSKDVHYFAWSSGEDRQAKNSQVQSLPLSGPRPAPVHGAVFMIGQQDFAGRRQHQA